MDDMNYFYSGGFSPEWINETKTEEAMPKHCYKHKDLDTLKQELAEIKDYIQDIRAREWQLGKLLKFNEFELAKE